MKEISGNHNNHNSVTTVTFLTREQIDYLDKLGKDCLFKYGHKLSRSKILSDLVTLLMHLGIDVNMMDLDNGDLWKSLLKVMKDESKTAT